MSRHSRQLKRRAAARTPDALSSRMEDSLRSILLELCGRLDYELSSEKDLLAIETALGKAALQGAQIGRDEIAAHMRAAGMPIDLPPELTEERDEWAEHYG